MFLHFCFILMVLGELVDGQSRPTIRINQGYLEGTKVYSDTGKLISSYLGIPYAAPPTGSLRFVPPQRHPGWNGTMRARDYAPICPQLPIATDMNEDCLYLNIWTPDKSAANYDQVPIVILFEGIGFSHSNRPISGEDLAAEMIMVVTVNYRLNVFGFLSTVTNDIRGNFGLLDQYFAMLWVKENSRNFGGDGDRITLYGNGAGAASVIYHMISPRTEGLFHQAIISSGSALSPWHLATNSKYPAQRILSLLGCSEEYTTNILRCLQSKSTTDILRAYEEYIESGGWPDIFLPVIDNFLTQEEQYLPLSPEQALKQRTYMNVPILTGITKPTSDSQYRQWIELASQGYKQLSDFFDKKKIPELINRYRLGSGRNANDIKELLVWKYMTNSQGDVRILLQQLKNIDFEAKIEAPHYLQLDYLASSYVQPIYAYNFDIEFVFNSSDNTITSDLVLLFGPALLKQLGRMRFNSNELSYSQLVKQLWTNFIAFGHPTIKANSKVWRRYTTNDNYIETFETILDFNNAERIQRVSFWTNLLPKLGNSSFGTNDLTELQLSPDPASGFRHAMYTLVGLVLALLGLLLICIVLLKKRAKEQERHLHMGY